MFAVEDKKKVSEPSETTTMDYSQIVSSRRECTKPPSLLLCSWTVFKVHIEVLISYRDILKCLEFSIH